MKNTIYLESKKLLTSIAKEAKRQYGKHDLPMQNQIINDQADQIMRQINHYAMKETISEKRAALYCRWINFLACKLHPVK